MTSMSWEEFFSSHGNKISGARFFAFQGEFEFSGIVRSVQDHSPHSQNVRIVLRDVSCRKYQETTEWTLFGRSTCIVHRKMTCFEEIRSGVFSLQLDDLHSAFVIIDDAVK